MEQESPRHMINAEMSIPIIVPLGYAWTRVTCTCNWSSGWLLSGKMNLARAYFEIHCQQAGQDAHNRPPKPNF